MAKQTHDHRLRKRTEALARRFKNRDSSIQGRYGPSKVVRTLWDRQEEIRQEEDWRLKKSIVMPLHLRPYFKW